MLIITFIEEDMMKMNRIVFAAVVVMVVALVSCGGGGGGGAPGFPGGDIDDLENYPGNTVATENDVFELLDYVNNTSYDGSGFWSLLNDVRNQANEKALTPYGWEWWWSLATQSSASMSLDYDGTSFSKTTGTVPADKRTVVATVAGSASGSMSASKPFGVFDWGSDRTEGQWEESSGSYDLTYKITTGTFPGSVAGTFGFIQGVIEMSGSDSEKTTLLRKYLEGTEGDQTETEKSSETATSVALSASNGRVGAKLLISKGYESEATTYRASDSTSGTSWSSLEVYDNAGNLKFTLMSGSARSLVTKAESNLGPDFGYVD
jgi:hypothetical protein